MKKSKDTWLELREQEALEDLEEHQSKFYRYIAGCDLYKSSKEPLGEGIFDRIRKLPVNVGSNKK